jgi:hypothetical protein
VCDSDRQQHNRIQILNAVTRIWQHQIYRPTKLYNKVTWSNFQKSHLHSRSSTADFVHAAVAIAFSASYSQANPRARRERWLKQTMRRCITAPSQVVAEEKEAEGMSERIEIAYHCRPVVPLHSHQVTWFAILTLALRGVLTPKLYTLLTRHDSHHSLTRATQTRNCHCYSNHI